MQLHAEECAKLPYYSMIINELKNNDQHHSVAPPSLYIILFTIGIRRQQHHHPCVCVRYTNKERARWNVVKVAVVLLRTLYLCWVGDDVVNSFVLSVMARFLLFSSSSKPVSCAAVGLSPRWKNVTCKHSSHHPRSIRIKEAEKGHRRSEWKSIGNLEAQSKAIIYRSDVYRRGTYTRQAPTGLLTRPPVYTHTSILYRRGIQPSGLYIHTHTMQYSIYPFFWIIQERIQ